MTLWEDIKECYFKMIRYSLSHGILSYDTRQGIITLLEKPQRELLRKENWRPIILLGADYKILAKALAKHVMVVLPKIIHADQTGFIKKHYIGENIRKALDAIQQAEVEQLPAVLISIDFQKAFDMVSFQAVWGLWRSLDSLPH